MSVRVGAKTVEAKGTFSGMRKNRLIIEISGAKQQNEFVQYSKCIGKEDAARTQKIEKPETT